MIKTLTPIIVLLIRVKDTTESSSNPKTEWIHPHNMIITDYESHNLNTHYEPSTSECTSTETISLSHYKRLINFILNLVKIDDSDYSGHLNLKISKADFRFLLQFVTENESIENKAMLNKIDKVMNKILTRSKLEYIEELIITWADFIYFHFYNRTTTIVFSSLLLLVIIYKLLKASFTVWSVMKRLLLLLWVTDFAFRWIGLLQEAEINQLSDRLRYASVPANCDPSKMSWFQYLTYSLSSSSECREYYQRLYKDSFYEVAPLQVISYQLGIVLYTPATHMGKAIGNFVSGMLASLPWGINVILLPALLIFTLIIICLILSFSTKTSFGFNLAYLIQFHFGSKERNVIGDTLSGKNLSALVNVLHRNMIENVNSPTVNESDTTEQPITLKDETIEKENANSATATTEKGE